MTKIIAAIDSLKGCLTSQEANRAAAEGIHAVWPKAEVVEVPVSDGGEGFLEAYQAANGGKMVELTVSDPLMRPVRTAYLLHDDTAVIEMAKACGLTLQTEEERNPMVATSYGVGQLVADAVRSGAKHVIVGLGGSATSDAGMGMLRALIDAFAKRDDGTRGCWDDITVLKSVSFTIATDVRNPLCGERGAAYVFAPQKFSAKKAEEGIADEIQTLDRRAAKFAALSAKHFGFDRSGDAGAGAAGGLGYAFMQYLDADSQTGIKLLLNAICFKDIIRDADLVITGEGAADRQTLMGKLSVGILHQAGSIPVCLIAGRIANREELLQAGFADVVCINPPGLPLTEAMRKEVAKQHIARTVGNILKVRQVATTI
ncbi:MAG: glycerate kinase [Prevotella sp.]|nr:glycerate kinase [Prevotella sp.]